MTTLAAITVERTGGGIATVRLRGEHDIANVAELERALASTSDATGTVVDMSGVRFVDSSVLGALVNAAGRDREAPFAIVLGAAGNPTVRRLLELTGLATVLPTYGSIEEATAAIAGRPT